MKSYNARLARSRDKRFNEFPIILKTLAPVHKSTRLSWVEELDENASSSEIDWYNHILDHNLEDE